MPVSDHHRAGDRAARRSRPERPESEATREATAMQPSNRRFAGMSARALSCVRLAAVAAVAVGALLAVTGQRATASTLNGVATIATPGTLTPLRVTSTGSV